MLKYKNAVVTFAEVPEEVTLCINITGCPVHCEGCHSPELWEDTGHTLDGRAIDTLISNNQGISCVCFMGGDSEPEIIPLLAEVVKKKGLKVGWYSGQEHFPNVDLSSIDFLKVGPYIKEKGGLDNPNTNQRLYSKIQVVEETSGKIINYWTDITDEFYADKEQT